MENNFRNSAIRWQISKHVNILLRMVVLDLIVNEMLRFEIFDLEKADQGPLGVNFAMVSIVGKYSNRQVVNVQFCTSSHVSEMLAFYIFTLKK